MYGHNPGDLIDRFARVSPIEVSPHDPHIVYHASQFLYRTTDEGVTWERISPDLTAFEVDKQVISGTPITRDITGEEFYSTIYAVEESPIEPGLIWVGANDGPVHVTRDSGNTWTDVTPHDLPPNGRVQSLEPSPHDPAKAYVAAYRYLLDDWEPYIYRTTDYGMSWTRLTTGDNGIPADYPTRVVREDPDREGLLYAGTEFGMFISFDDGTHWQSFQQNLPVTPVTDIQVYRKDLVISTMGRSFWIMDDLTPLHQLTEGMASASVHLFAPRAAYRVGRRGFGFGQPAGSGPQYLSPAVNIDYYLSESVSEEVVLEILDADGSVLRRFSSMAPGELVRWTQEMREPVLVGAGTPRLPRQAGHNRFRWDLRHAGAWDQNTRAAGRGGPLATPGRYQARLSVGDWSETQPFELLIDPRVAKDGVTRVDLAEQLALNLRIRDLMSRARFALHQIDEAQEATGDSTAAQHSGLENLRAALETRGDIRYPQPMLIDQIQYLWRMMNAADQKPGRDAHERYEHLLEQLENVLAPLGEALEGGAG